MAKEKSFTKRGPGRRHRQGAGPALLPREVEVSDLHPVLVKRLRQALMQGLRLSSKDREDLRAQIVANGGRA